MKPRLYQVLLTYLVAQMKPSLTRLPHDTAHLARPTTRTIMGRFPPSLNPEALPAQPNTSHHPFTRP